MNLNEIEQAKRRIKRIPFRVTECGCHIPTILSRNDVGYVRIRFNYRHTMLHRLVAFAYLNLDIDNEFILALHKKECPNRDCFNQEHLYVGDQKQNMEDMISSGHGKEQQRELCPRGHEYDLIVKTKVRGKRRFYRRCSQCNKIRKERMR